MVKKCHLKSLRLKCFYPLISLFLISFAMTPWALAANVTLAWDENTPSPDSYRLFQRTSGQSYDYNNEVYEGSDTTIALTNLSPDTTYYFVVRACSGQDESTDSNEVTYRTPAASDTNTDQSNSTGGTGTTIVVDNGGTGSSSTGLWSTSSGPNPYGSSSVYSRDAGATYTYETSLTGVLDLSVWWTEWASRPTSAPIKIYDGKTLLDTVYVNQRNNGGRWNQLGQGRYTFSHSARVTIVSDGSSSSTCADAVKFYVVSEDPNPDTNPNVNQQDTDQSNNTSSTNVIDNGGSGTSSTGSWSISGGSNAYGKNSLYSREAGATYTFTSSTTGVIDISLWWTEWASRSSSVLVKIYDGNVLLTKYIEYFVDQKSDGGRWNLLDRFSFENSARVTIVSSGSNSSTCADAVKFSVISTQPNPDINPPTDQQSQNQNSGSDSITVIDNGGSGTASSGSWKVSGGKNPYGSNSLYSNQANAIYSYSASRTGNLELSLWWTEWPSRCSSVPVEIYDGNTYRETITVDQRKNAGEWFVLQGKEVSPFSKSVKIEIVSEGGCSTSADAIRIQNAK